MTGTLIIDGYNLILRLGLAQDLAPGELARRRMVLEDCLIAFGRQRDTRPVVVYDGLRLSQAPGGGRRDGSLEVIFVEPPAEADDFIVQRVEQHLQEGETVHVVTSDRRLTVRVTGAGATSFSVEEFGATLADVMARPGRPAIPGAMPDIEAHFLALHRQEETRAAAAVERQTPAAAAPPRGTGPDPVTERHRRRKKGVERQERRLRARGKVPRRRRRH